MEHASKVTSRRQLGQSGENLALEHLSGLGFALVNRNFNTKLGEVDLIVEKGDLLVFVEVRFRGTASFGGAEATVSRAKQRRVVLAAMQFCTQHRITERALRFDVVAITGTEVVHLENAFDAGW